MPRYKWRIDGCLESGQVVMGSHWNEFLRAHQVDPALEAEEIGGAAKEFQDVAGDVGEGVSKLHL